MPSNVSILKQITPNNFQNRIDVYSPTAGYSGYVTCLQLTVNIKSVSTANFPYIPDDTPPDVINTILEDVAASAQFKEIELLLKKGQNEWIEKATIRLFNKEPYYDIDLMPYFSVNTNTLDIAEDLTIGIKMKLGSNNTLIEADKITIFGMAVEEKKEINNTNNEGEMGRIPGELMYFAGRNIPPGWLPCDNSERPIDGYQKLYEELGTTWGALTNGLGAPGATHFRLPDARGRVLIGAGAGAGLTPRTIGQLIGAETHTLSATEMPAHTHAQVAHTHVQDAHNHIQDGHNHAQVAHTHVQDAHTHAQNAHGHAYNWFTGANAASSLTASGGVLTPTANANTTSNVAATNQNAIATNQAATATNQAATATNQAATATNQTTTATNQNTGGGVAHNNMQPAAVVNCYVFAG